MPEGEGVGQPQRYCRVCGAEARPGNAFCVSCGRQLNAEVNVPGEAGSHPVVRGAAPRRRSLLDQGNTRVALYGTGALLLLLVVYLLFSYSVSLGVFLISLSVLVVLLIRKTRGTQTSFERRVFEKAGQHGDSARRAYEEGKHRELAQNAYQQSRKAYEEANARYRDWSEARAAEQEREARHARFDRYLNFFNRANNGSQRFLDWWQAYQYEEAEGEQPLTSDLLRSARDRAEAGLVKCRGIEGPLDQLLQEDSFGEADRLLDDVREDQEGLEGEESVFPPLVAVHARVKGLNGWEKYREELEKFVKDLEELLGSPKVRTVPANRLRFPDPPKPKPEAPEFKSTLPPRAPDGTPGWRQERRDDSLMPSPGAIALMVAFVFVLFVFANNPILGAMLLHLLFAISLVWWATNFFKNFF